MANRDNPNGFQFVKINNSNAGSPVIKTLDVGASTTIAIGDAVIYTSGLAAIALSNSPWIAGVAIEAVATGAGETGTIQIIPAYSDYVFRGQCSGTYAVSINGTNVDIEGATGIMEINENGTTEEVVHVIEISDVQSNAVGVNSKVDFSFVRSAYTGMLETA